MAASDSSNLFKEGVYPSRPVTKLQCNNSGSSNSMPSHPPPFQSTLCPVSAPTIETPVFQSYENPSPSNFTNFLQQINFSIPPPFPPPMMPCPASSTFRPPFPADFSKFIPISKGIPSNDPSSSGKNLPFKSCLKNEFPQIEEVIMNLKKKERPPSILIHEISSQLKNYFSSLEKFRNNLENLNSVSSLLDDETWKEKAADLSSKQEILKKLKLSIEIDPASLALLKYKIKKRQKKRLAKKKRKHAKEKPFSKYQVAQAHMQHLQQIADSQKQENKFKEEADSILYSVRQKKSEANSQIQFLSALSKLYTARIHVLNSQNKHPSSDSVQGFNKIIDKLKSMWERQLKDYVVEENGLKIMLEDLAVTAENDDRTSLRKVFGQWLKLMFGTTHLQEDSYYSSIDELVEIRNQWDKYIVFEETNSSQIPVGWVVPKCREDDAWSKFVS